MLIFYTYLATLVVSRIILNAESVFDYRFLSPIFPFGIFLWVSFMISIILQMRIINLKVIKVGLSIMIAAYFTILVNQAIKWVFIQKDGYSYASKSWKSDSLLLKMSREIDSSYNIYSNLPIMTYYYGEKYPFSIYEHDYANINFENAIVVLFKNINSRPLVFPKNIQGLRQIDIENEGLIFCSAADFDKITKLYHDLNEY